MSKQLETLLRQSGLANDTQLRRANERARQSNASLVEVLIREEHLSEDAVAGMFEQRLKIPRVRPATMLPDQDAMRRVPERLARKHACLPISVEGRVLVLAMVNPIDYLAIQDVEFAATLSVRAVVATRTEVLDGIEERYGAEDRIGSFLANVPEVQDMQIMSEDAQDVSMDTSDSKSAAEVAPVVKMCNLVIHDAIRSAASDVHIEPALHDVQVRMRVDGVLRDYTRVPKWLHGPVVSRMKILAKLDIAERRLPQDGRINVQYQGRSIDIRVSTLPTHFGEKLVLRVLGGMSAPKIERLGLSPEQQAMLESAIAQPQGMILVTGPTGSGKTTTLYALLAHHHKPEVNIVTVEDPIEYQLAGINQVQINTKAGLNFAGVLRSILRQDPDVILVGETRDRETAEIAFQAAMTGHMVLSTLHTNSAVAAVSRLYDLQVDPSIIATSLTMAIAQRLVRRICEDCREAYEPDPQVLARVGLGADHPPVYRGKGCSACSGTGYSGRVGIYEMFRPTNAIRKMINDKASEADIRNTARQSGMMLLREDALEKVKAGITSPDEVLRVVQVDETEIPCPSCGAIIEADFSTCPYCMTSLKRLCSACGQSMKLEWKACPYCNTSALVQPVAEEVGTPVGQTPNAPAPSAPAPVERVPAGDVPAVVKTSPALAAPTRESAVPPSEREETWNWVPTFDADEIAARMIEPDPPAPPAEPIRQPALTTPPASARPTPHPATPPAPMPGPPLSVDTAGVEEAPRQRPLRILVVDDDPDIRMIVSATLHKLPVPVAVQQAVDGVDGVEKALAEPPDMVVLDVMMPRMDGFGVCRALRENVRTAFVPVLMLTASADQNSRTQGYLVGTDDYMSKPFLPLDLKLRVTRLLRRTYGI
ncbi:MAG: ATPase, T2SS/T4P/T4SS family [Acidobacteria bacterium]|nr:ATPase, T2SS/T4P/T4SS family [Acidobacteriota bacterium]